MFLNVLNAGYGMNNFYWASRYYPEQKPYYGHCSEHGDWENWWVNECPVHDGLSHLNYQRKKKVYGREEHEAETQLGLFPAATLYILQKRNWQGRF